MEKKKEYLKITLGVDKQPHIECNILSSDLMIVFINWMIIDKDVREIIILSIANYLQFTKEDDFLIKRLVRIAQNNTVLKVPPLEIPPINKIPECDSTTSQ